MATDQQILQMFDNGSKIIDIAAELGCGYRTIYKTLDLYNRDRTLPKKRQYKGMQTKLVQAGDRFGNWDVLEFAYKNRWKCRDIRNGTERLVTTQALRLSASSGCMELTENYIILRSQKSPSEILEIRGKRKSENIDYPSN